MSVEKGSVKANGEMSIQRMNWLYYCIFERDCFNCVKRKECYD